MSSPTRASLPSLLVLAALALTACIGRDIAGAANAWNGAAFSAEMFDPAHPTKPVSRIYLGDGRVRLESEDTSSIGAIVLDPSHGTTLIVNDPAKSYIDAGMFTSLVTIGFAPLMKVLRPAGSGDPCSQWNSAINPFGAFAKNSKTGQTQQWTCKSLGSESVGGRSAQKWDVASNDPTDGPMTIWVDDKLHVLSRTQDKSGTMEMRNIREGAQPDSLFTPPATYKKISISSLLGGMLGGGDSTKGGSSATSFLQKLQGAKPH
jgi:predicted small secreted protein